MACGGCDGAVWRLAALASGHWARHDNPSHSLSMTSLCSPRSGKHVVATIALESGYANRTGAGDISLYYQLQNGDEHDDSRADEDTDEDEDAEDRGPRSNNILRSPKLSVSCVHGVGCALASVQRVMPSAFCGQWPWGAPLW